MRKRFEMDMCNGPLLKKVWIFSIPLMLSGVLQLLFNMVDMVVVGRFVSSDALAAVGSTGSMVNLIVNLFMGLSVGAGVVVAQRFGASDTSGVSDTVHTSMLFSVIGGTVVVWGFVGVEAVARLNINGFYSVVPCTYVQEDEIPEEWRNGA